MHRLVLWSWTNNEGAGPPAPPSVNTRRRRYAGVGYIFFLWLVS